MGHAQGGVEGVVAQEFTSKAEQIRCWLLHASDLINPSAAESHLQPLTPPLLFFWRQTHHVAWVGFEFAV